MELRIIESQGSVSQARAPAFGPSAFLWGAAIGTLGGLIGLGGAEFRLPVLLSVFAFAPLEAVILNKAISLVVVASALPFRAGAVPWHSVFAAWPIIVNLLAGSLAGAWLGASFATRIDSGVLRRILAGLLAGIAAVLLFAHEPSASSGAMLGSEWRMTVGGLAGLAIGAVASIMGVAGGELLIPTLVLLFGMNITLAGSVSLAVSLPTMLAGFGRYSRDRSFAVIGRSRGFVATMAVGSIAGTFVGSQLLGVVPNRLLLPTLALILVVSAVKTWRHADTAGAGGTPHVRQVSESERSR